MSYQHNISTNLAVVEFATTNLNLEVNMGQLQ